MALRKILTDFAVINAKPKAQPYEISDGGQRGLRLAVFSSGQKSFVLRYRHPISGISRKMTLPPGLSLADARRFASEQMHSVAKGIDPIEHVRAEKQAKIEASEGTLASVAARYMDLAGKKLRSGSQYKSVLDRNILPHLGSRPVADLRRAEIVAAFDKVERKSGESAADMALGVLRTVLGWHEKRSDTFRSPIIPGMARVKASKHLRERTLNDDEIRRVWLACDERMGPYGQCVKLMLLTGARRNEAAKMRRSEIETVRDNGDQFTVWRLPASRSKNKREVVRPLSKAALQIIEDAPLIGEDSEFVFTLDGRKPLAMGNDRRKRQLDEISGCTGFTRHDLRRTFRTLLSRCRVPFEIAEMALGHTMPVLVRTYDQHSHLSAMLEAVEKVAAEIERIVEGEKTGKIIRARF
jgi:integrase